MKRPATVPHYRRGQPIGGPAQMLVLRPDDTGLDPRAWCVAAPAILVWPAAAAQPSAVVLARCGVFVARLSGAPHRLRYLVAAGDYAAGWRNGRVLLTRRAASV